jgi:phage terminase large subunit-like protein
MPKRIKRDNVPYDSWLHTGHINATPGNVIYYSFVQKFIVDLGQKYNIQEIAFDRWGAVPMSQGLKEAGFKVIDFGQGYESMSPPSKELMRLALCGRIAHDNHPVLDWMMGNV